MKDCVSLDVARRLKEAGWEQKANFWWQATYSRSPEMMGISCYEKCGSLECQHPVAWHMAYYDNSEQHFDIAAPTIGELLEALPNFRFEAYELGKNHDGKYYATAFIPLEEVTGEDKQSPRTFSDNPADALALLWIALKEKNIVE